MSQPTAQVYVNWGRTVAECPCGDAREVAPGQAAMTCCVGPDCPGHIVTLVWADEMPAILAALSERTSDKRKNWFPAGHPLAVAAGFPHGQTADELRAETDAGEARDAEAVADKRAELIAQLRELGAVDELIDELRKEL